MNFHTTELLPEVILQCAASDEVAEVIVVHNGGSPPLGPLEVDCALVEINLRENLGYAAAVNIALERARYPWALLINPDVRLDQDCIEQLAFWADHLGASIVGPRFYWDDVRQFRLPPATGCSAALHASAMLAGQHPLDAAIVEQQWAKRHDQFWSAHGPFVEPFLSGACLLIRRSSFSGIDLLDERFFMYYEDTQVCARATLHGNPPLCIPTAEAVHYWNRSPARADTKEGYMKASRESYIDHFYGNVRWPQIEKAAAPSLPPIVEFPFQDLTIAPQSAWLEMSPSIIMVPFVQVTLSENMRRFPADLWERLDPAWYYFRVRDFHGRVITRWRTQKLGTC